MNKDQIFYLIGKGCHNLFSLLTLPLTFSFGYNAVKHFSEIEGIDDILIGTVWTILSAYLGFCTLIHEGSRFALRCARKDINKEPEKYPFQTIDEIHIQDTQGLERILEETKKLRYKEWGTPLKSKIENNIAIITEIVDPETSKEKKFYKSIMGSMISSDTEKINKAGYNGFHHYHPTRIFLPRFLQALNFTVSFLDRFSPFEGINLLTFNMSKGPEIIGFNTQHTYIPENKEKTKLIKATSKEIIAYLNH